MARFNGVGFFSSIEFIKNETGPEGWARIQQAVPEAARNDMRDALVSSWLSAETLGAYWGEFGRTPCRGDRALISRSFNRMGRSIAEQNLNTIYKFMLKVLSPNRLISLLPNLWNI